LNGAFERFSIYGFTIDYPEECRVEFNSKSRRETGDVVFRLPKNIGIFLSWGELGKVLKRFGSAEEHANYSLDTMKKGKNVKNFERVSRDTISLHNHNGSVNKVRFEERTLRLFARSKDIPREAYSLHVHCDKSERYFVLYSMASANDETRLDRIMELMRESFICH
jgi:Zn-finger nucleic acid-binding protein